MIKVKKVKIDQDSTKAKRGNLFRSFPALLIFFAAGKITYAGRVP